MRMKLSVLTVAALLALSACVPQRQAYEPVSPTIPASPAAESIAATDTAAAPTAFDFGVEMPKNFKEAALIDDPSALKLDGSLSWMWESEIQSPKRIAAMYSMCVAITAKDDAGRDCVYASQVYDVGKTPLYTATSEYPYINSVSGSKFSVYFIEHNDTKWRLMYMPLDSGAESAEVIDEGVGFIPTLSPHTETTLSYVAQTGDSYAIRVREKKWDSDPAKLLGEIPLPGAPLETDETYFHDVYVGVTYVQVYENAYAIVTHDVEGSPVYHYVKNRPVSAQANEGGVVWLDESGRLFCWLRNDGETYLLGENVEWYDIVSFGILFADEGGMRLMYAQTLDGEESGAGGIGRIAIAQGNWKYIGGTMFSLGENYVCVLRERDGDAQFVGMDLTLLPGE